MKVIESNVTDWSTNSEMASLLDRRRLVKRAKILVVLGFRSVFIPFRSLFIDSADCSCFDGSDPRELMEFQIKVTKA